LDPSGGVIRPDRLIEGSIDFDGVKKLSEEGSFMKIF